MSAISDSSVQLWQGIAAVVGALVGGIVMGVGRRAGSVASRSPAAAPAGDALQRAILDEIRGLRGDYAAARAIEEDRRTDERFDAIERNQKVARANVNDVKTLIGAVLARLPDPDGRLPRLRPPSEDDDS